MSELRRYVPRPYEVQAVQFDGTNADEIAGLFGIPSLNFASLDLGDYIVQTSSGALERISAFSFASRYDLAPE